MRICSLANLMNQSILKLPMTHPTPGKILVIIDNYCITVWNSIIIFHIKLKKLKPYDFDYIN